ncbi:DUF3081 family protein [Thalassotalea euphylliae]|uniref:DUF3081 family protein n=1 Tax=Thalassotalea euphylliae TaxID=1655234 RepID=A0A3E0UCG4_9GAMM|nr:DUF3081 family protein [Thalassotalea euphylliae]REL34576.1 DUF3081 family protein [Thalassotalea euphylliae]
MHNELDVKYCLSVFNKVLSDGEVLEGKRHWQGLSAWADFDGYTCYLQFNQVVVTLLFHGKYDVSKPNEEAWQQFLKKIKSLADRL